MGRLCGLLIIRPDLLEVQMLPHFNYISQGLLMVAVEHVLIFKDVK